MSEHAKCTPAERNFFYPSRKSQLSAFSDKKQIFVYLLVSETNFREVFWKMFFWKITLDGEIASDKKFEAKFLLFMKKNVHNFCFEILSKENF